MNAKTNILRKKKSLVREPSVCTSPAYVMCHEIVTDLADNLMGDILTRYEEYQRESSGLIFCELLNRTCGTMVGFEALAAIDFRAQPVSLACLDELQPVVSCPDTYNRKVVDNRALFAPKSAIELHPKSLLKVHSAVSISRLQRPTLKKQVRQVQCLQIDFNAVHLKRASSVDAQLRAEKAAARAKARNAKFIPKVN